MDRFAALDVTKECRPGEACDGPDDAVDNLRLPAARGPDVAGDQLVLGHRLHTHLAPDTWTYYRHPHNIT